MFFHHRNVPSGKHEKNTGIFGGFFSYFSGGYHLFFRELSRRMEHGSLVMSPFFTSPNHDRYFWSTRWLLFQVMSNIPKSWDSYQPLWNHRTTVNIWGGKEAAQLSRVSVTQGADAVHQLIPMGHEPMI